MRLRCQGSKITHEIKCRFVVLHGIHEMKELLAFERGAVHQTFLERPVHWTIAFDRLLSGAGVPAQLVKS
jgi:hypothetical protein